MSSRSYRVFHRAWWKESPGWPNGLEPCPGERHFICWADSEEEARAACRSWNAKHDPGRLSDKAEYESTR
jgi:hypothetical protein